MPVIVISTILVSVESCIEFTYFSLALASARLYYFLNFFILFLVFLVEVVGCYNRSPASLIPHLPSLLDSFLCQCIPSQSCCYTGYSQIYVSSSYKAYCCHETYYRNQTRNLVHFQHFQSILSPSLTPWISGPILRNPGFYQSYLTLAYYGGQVSGRG